MVGHIGDHRPFIPRGRKVMAHINLLDCVEEGLRIDCRSGGNGRHGVHGDQAHSLREVEALLQHRVRAGLVADAVELDALGCETGPASVRGGDIGA
jgi:hypothetical protein